MFTPFSVLITERLQLRQLLDSDDEAISALRSDVRVNKYIERSGNVTTDEARAFINKINDGISACKWLYWAIVLKENETFIGTICLWNISDDGKCAELGFELIPDFQRQGFMNEALKAIITCAFDSARFLTLEAFTHRENEASVSLLQRNKFIHNSLRSDRENPDNLIFTRSE
jgi:ribosomal-protein-alanine N-acetyltransferase